MGKIKTRLIKRTSEALTASDLEFGEDFTKNKRALKKEMPSKKVRNQIAGYISRLRKHKRIEQEKLEEFIKNKK